MRVTQRMMSENLNFNLQSVLRRLNAVNQRVGTGRRVHHPSDDPVATESIMRMQSLIEATEQYLRNVDDADSWLGYTDAALGHAGDALQRARELAIYGANGTLSPEDRAAVAQEVEEILSDLLDTANTRFADRYIFGGTRTDTAPFVRDASGAILYVGAPGDPGSDWPPGSHTLVHEVGPGATVELSIHGDRALLPAMEALAELAAALRGDDADAVQKAVSSVDAAMDELLRWRAEVGARMNRLELVRARLTEDRENLKRLLSDRQDVDMAEAIMELKMEENVYRAALAVGARILQPTLMDYLR